MAVSHAVFVFSFVFLLYFAQYVSSDESMCVPKTKCKCQFENGTGIDLNNTAKEEFYSTSEVTLDTAGVIITYYYFHPCTNQWYKSAESGVQNDCKNVSICQRYMQYVKGINGSLNMLDDSHYIASGNVENSEITSNGHSFSIYYKYEANTVTIKLVCVDDEKNQLLITNQDPKDRVLTFYSRDACLKRLEAEHHRSLGTTLIIILFVMFAVYLILGVLTKKFLMGAQGIEVLPNLAFWTELPGLVRDGLQFVKNGFKVSPSGVSSAPGQSPNPHSYDSI